MASDFVRRFLNFSNRKNIAVALFLAVLLLSLICVQTAHGILSYEKIYSGVYINNIYVGNLTVDQARKLLEANIRDSYLKQTIDLKCKGFSAKIKIADIETRYNVDAALNSAFLVGRRGNILSRLIEITNAQRYGKILIFPATFNRDAANSTVNDLYNKVFRPVKETDYIIDDVKVTIISGTSGQSFDKVSVLNKIEESICRGSGGFIDIPVIVTKPRRIDIDALYNKIYTEPKDASYTVQNNEVIVIPHVIGKSINKTLGAQILASMENKEGAIKVIPLILSQPKVLDSDIKPYIFRDTLHSTSTTFSTSNVNRAHNIRIAASKIDGTVLASGEIFSYNQVVGPRTPELGYKAANTYVGGKIVEGIGGGICQVSSTLYNSLLFSDLEVLERTNHQFTVSYIPLGHDAAVDYSGVDLKFRNSTAWPIKILATVSGGTITITIKGTNENPGKKVETRTKVLRTIDFTEKITYDPSLPEGTRIVTTAGMKGFTVELYKIIKQDNMVASESLVSTNYYLPLRQEVTVGTKKVPEAERPDSIQPLPPDNQEVEPPPATE